MLHNAACSALQAAWLRTRSALSAQLTVAEWNGVWMFVAATPSLVCRQYLHIARNDAEYYTGLFGKEMLKQMAKDNEVCMYAHGAGLSAPRLPASAWMGPHPCS
jgi:hypothetical protein